ncbi:MAG: NUDIX hydrolase [Hyphomicrobiaceae bacterium]
MTEPASPRLSATLLLARDGTDGLELFMVVRNRQVEFASGAIVFPGGTLNSGDRDPRLRALCDGGERLNDDALALRVAASREAFEECGVLYVKRRGETSLVDGQTAAALGDAYRVRLERGEISVYDLLQSENLRLAIDELQHFAHWITPVQLPKRYDTHFFLARAPEDQLFGHDGRETVDSIWISPGRALTDADAGLRTLVFATRLNIARVGQSRTVAEAIAHASASPVVTVLPTLERIEGGQVLRIPEEAGYGGSIFRSLKPATANNPNFA